MTDIKEQFFERLLKELFHRRGDGFVLKGGIGMRALFGDNRRTKDIDLDFTNPKRTALSLHKTIERAITVAAREVRAKELRVGKPKAGEHSPRWKVNFRDGAGRTHHLEIEVSRDPERAPPGEPIQHRYTPHAISGVAPFYVDIYDRPAMIATKLAALLGRTVPAPRDVFDLDQLIASGDAPTSVQIEWALRRASVPRADALGKVRARMVEMNWAMFASQVLDALPEEAAERIDESEWAAMKQRVAVFIERLLA